MTYSAYQIKVSKTLSECNNHTIYFSKVVEDLKNLI